MEKIEYDKPSSEEAEKFFNAYQYIMINILKHLSDIHNLLIDCEVAKAREKIPNIYTELNIVEKICDKMEPFSVNRIEDNDDKIEDDNYVPIELKDLEESSISSSIDENNENDNDSDELETSSSTKSQESDTNSSSSS